MAQGDCTLLVPDKSYDNEKGTTYEYFATCPITEPLPTCPANQYAMFENPKQVIRVFVSAFVM